MDFQTCVCKSCQCMQNHFSVCTTYPTPVPDRAHSSATTVKVQTLGRELLLTAICCSCQLGATESVFGKLKLTDTEIAALEVDITDLSA
jgi:hypothetical protein